MEHRDADRIAFFLRAGSLTFPAWLRTQGKAVTTSDRYQSMCEASMIAVGVPMNDWTPSEVLAALERLAPQSRPPYRAAWRAYADWCGLPAEHCVRHIRVRHVESDTARRLPEETCDKLMIYEGDLRHMLSFRLALLGGLRRQEAAMLTTDCLTRDAIHIRGEWAKSGRPRTLPTHPDIYRLVQEIASPGPTVLLNNRGRPVSLATVDTWWKVVALACGCRGYRYHDLRHTFSSRAAESLPSFVVQRALGHRSLVTTERYLHLAGAELRHYFETLPWWNT